MKDTDAAYLEIKKKEIRVECIRMAINVAVSNGTKQKITTEKVLADAKKLSEWINE